MNRVLLFIVSLLLASVLAIPAALAQDRPRPSREGEDRPPRPGGFPEPGMGPGAPGGFGGPQWFRGGGPEMQKLEMLRGYIDVVDRFTRLSRDPASAGVAAVVSASDILKQRGTDAAIEHFNKLLPEVKNEAVQRAIRIQLVDLYKQAGQADKALEQLDAMMKAAPAGAGMSGGATPAP
jgi:hypothetical protein